jgi:hypothetical protein
MKQQKGSSDSFGTFLEGLKRREQGQKTAGGTPLRILTILLEEGPSLSQTSLTKSTTEFENLAEALKTMREAGLVAMAGPAGEKRCS